MYACELEPIYIMTRYKNFPRIDNLFLVILIISVLINVSLCWGTIIYQVWISGGLEIDWLFSDVRTYSLDNDYTLGKLFIWLEHIIRQNITSYSVVDCLWSMFEMTQTLPNVTIGRIECYSCKVINENKSGFLISKLNYMLIEGGGHNDHVWP